MCEFVFRNKTKRIYFQKQFLNFTVLIYINYILENRRRKLLKILEFSVFRHKSLILTQFTYNVSFLNLEPLKHLVFEICKFLFVLFLWHSQRISFEI